MNGGRTLFKIFGIDIKLHFSWWFIFILIAWSLSGSYFPQFLPGKNTALYWLMGIASALLLFISVLLHELSHSLVAKAKKIKVESITLFFFGGVAGITNEDLPPKDEFQMALAGPLFSLVLAGLFYLLHSLSEMSILSTITLYLYQLNFVLAIFNLVPAFPLDGGRAFRALLYTYYKDLKKATHIAAWGGKFFAGFLIVIGLLGIIAGTGGGGLWYIVLGGFLYFIAKMSYEQVIIKEVLNAIPISKIMTKKISTLNPEIKFSEFLKQYSFSSEDSFVIHDKKFSGILDIKRIDPLPEKMQEITTLKQLAVPFSGLKVLSMKDTTYSAFQKFSEQNLELLPVMEKEKMLGIVARRTVTQQLVWQLKFESESGKEKIKKKNKM